MVQGPALDVSGREIDGFRAEAQGRRGKMIFGLRRVYTSIHLLSTGIIMSGYMANVLAD